MQGSVQVSATHNSNYRAWKYAWIKSQLRCNLEGAKAYFSAPLISLVAYVLGLRCPHEGGLYLGI